MFYDQEKCGARIRQIRKQNGYTQELLARELDIDRSLLSHIESGKGGCTVDNFIQLAVLFHVSLNWLILGKEHGDQSNAQLKKDIKRPVESLEKFEESLSIVTNLL